MYTQNTLIRNENKYTNDEGQPMKYDEIWGQVTDKLNDTITALNFENWLQLLSIHYINDVDKVILLSWHGDERLIDHLSSNYKDLMEMAFNRVLKEKYTLVIRSDREYNVIENNSCREDGKSADYKSLGLKTFDSYVIGNYNEYAYMVLKNVVNNLGKKYNPLYVYGNEGCGKTHLLQAIVHSIISEAGGSKIIYIDASMFSNEMVYKLANRDKGNSIISKYYDADMLVMDDIHLLENDKHSQEELIKIIDYLIANEKQIILAGNCELCNLNIDETIKTKLSFGMTVDIQEPGFETKFVILKHLTDKYQMDFNDKLIETIAFIANNSNGNIRELKAAFVRLVEYCRLFGNSVNLERAKIVLADYIESVSKNTDTNECI